MPAGLPWRALYLGTSPLVKLVTAVLPPRLPRTVTLRRSDGILEDQAFWPYYPTTRVAFPAGSPG